MHTLPTSSMSVCLPVPASDEEYSTHKEVFSKLIYLNGHCKIPLYAPVCLSEDLPVQLMKSKGEVIGQESNDTFNEMWTLEDSLRFRDAYQTSAELGLFTPNYMFFIWVFLKQYYEEPFMFFFPLSNYHFSFECMLLISYARLEVTLVTPLCGTSTQKQFTLQKLRSVSACSLFVS